MIFEKPNVLYFLFLLIIPVLVHLFQLRKFKTTRFSNVALLERIKLQSRKSSTIKKWLVLSTRLLGLLFLILAFAKPFIPTSEASLKENEVVIYLDNSFSMQLPGTQMSLLEEAKQSLWKQLEDDQRFSLFTNDRSWKHVKKSEIKSDFFSIEFTSVHFSFENLLLKAESMFEDEESKHDFFAITDALNFEDDINLKSENKTDISFIVKKPSSLQNYSIDSAELISDNTEKSVKTNISSNLKSDQDITVSLYDDNDLIAKSKANFQDSTTASVRFELSNRDFKKGKLQIETDGMSYDNTLFFSLNEQKKISVLSLYSNSQTGKSFLKSIYTSAAFNFQEFSLSNFDYSKISDVDLLILNEIKDINPILISRVNEFLNNGGTLIIIPDEQTNLGSFKTLNNEQNIYSNLTKNPREVTTINYKHPLFQNVFSEKIQNFDYPFTESAFKINLSFSPILSFSNGEAFLAKKNNIYSFASSLSKENSNFSNSPLIVPVFYNIGLQSKKTPSLYSTLGEKELIDVKTSLGKDEVLKLENEQRQIIPQQTKLGNTIQINTQYQPENPGFYELKQKDSVLLHLSFNYNRQESDLNPLELSSLGTKTFESLQEGFKSFIEDTKILELWIWMLIFAVGFFLLELLILRFVN